MPNRFDNTWSVYMESDESSVSISCHLVNFNHLSNFLLFVFQLKSTTDNQQVGEFLLASLGDPFNQCDVHQLMVFRRFAGVKFSSASPLICHQGRWFPMETVGSCDANYSTKPVNFSFQVLSTLQAMMFVPKNTSINYPQLRGPVIYGQRVSK